MLIWLSFASNTSEAKLYVAISTDNGATFDNPVLEHTEADGLFLEDNATIVWDNSINESYGHQLMAA